LLRLLGYDTVFFSDGSDTRMVNIAQAEKRIILTRDTHIQKRRLVTSGEVKALLIKSDRIDDQIKQVIHELNLHGSFRPFTLCLEDNQPLERRNQEDIRDQVPPYVWKTQKEYVQCPQCQRIYWKGTHWAAMTERLKNLEKNDPEDKI
jgi:uncharacterized protein with PIN domain